MRPREFKNVTYIWTPDSSLVLPTLFPVQRHIKLNKKIWLNDYREILKDNFKPPHLKKKNEGKLLGSFFSYV